MQPEDDDQSFQEPERRSGFTINRDTLVLLGALAFLIIAIGLTFLFPLGFGDQSQPTLVAEQPTTPGEPGYPAPTSAVVDNGYPAHAATTPNDSSEGSGYPAPNAETTSTSTATIEAEPEPTDQTTTPANDLTEEAAYPIPVGSPPAQSSAAPTFAPTRLTVTPRPITTLALSPTSAPTTPPDTPTPDVPKEPSPTATQTPTPSPTAPPVDVLEGNIRWRADQSPILLPNDVQLAPDAILIIDPGVEVRLGGGVSFYVDGAQFLALGTPEQPVRFVSDTPARWEGLFIRPGSYAVMENMEMRGGGAAGMLLFSDQSQVIIRSSRFNDNGGALLFNDSRLEVLDSEVAGNDMPYGAALDVVYTRGNGVILHNNRVGGNRLGDGAPNVRISNQSVFETLSVDIQGNLLRGGIDNLVLSTDGPLQGVVACNALIGGNMGLSLRTQTLQVPEAQLTVVNNLIDVHTPPIIPIYLKYGIGRGAASEIPLDMRNNWWGESSGPYDPEYNPEGRGDSVGDNITFAPWLTEAAACVPQP